MTESIAIYVPTSRVSGSKLQLAPRLDSLAGKTVGFINNRWRCMHIICDELRRLLQEQYGVARFVEKQGPSACPLPGSQLSELAEEADAVICGIAN